MKKKKLRQKSKFKSTVFGEYLMDRFFFKIYTHQKKTGTLDRLDLRQLQTNNIVSIVHEYLHYLHEVSTHIGTLSLVFSTSLRTILSKYTNTGLSSSDFDLNISLTDASYLVDLTGTIDTLIGDHILDRELKIILGYELSVVNIKIPNEMEMVNMPFEIPQIQIPNGTLAFGKFYLYEGLAYELEQVYAHSIGRVWVDDQDGTEYTVLRYFSKHIVPSISQRTMLTLASLSLAYINCGAMYVSMLQKLAIDLTDGGTEESLVKVVKEKVVRDYTEKTELLDGVLAEIEDAFKYRSSLKIAFSDLKTRYLNASDQRLKNPAFEVEMIFNRDLDTLLTIVPPCDYMFVFSNKNEFMRDFYGTSKFRVPGGTELAVHHNIFIANAHYANVLFYTFTGDIESFEAGEDEICCPFYTSCDLKFRKESPKVCASTPWKTYDAAYADDKKFCWYGSGVGFLKGIDISPDEN